jgi:hypothetical protein
MNRFAAKFSSNTLFLRLHLLGDQIMQGQLFVQESGVCLGQFQPAQKS